MTNASNQKMWRNERTRNDRGGRRLDSDCHEIPTQKEKKTIQIMPSSSSYPYSRVEECSWQPEEVARQLSSLGGGSNFVSTDSSHLLMHRGWSSGQVAALRRMYGSNSMIDDEQDQPTSSSVIVRMFPCLPAILTALNGQLKEPLILMLLSSAGLSLFLGNTADAISIGVALLIVSLVAAVQEYRSEAALEKLAHLVPPTCTVLRDGRVLDGFLAKELVVGDLVLLGTGEYVLFCLCQIESWCCCLIVV
jgi:Ca2+-transporting ATPase